MKSITGQFNQDGVVVLKNVFSNKIIDQVNTDIDQFILEKIEGFDKSRNKIYLQEVNVRYKFDVFKSIIHECQLIKYFQDVLETKYVKIWHDQLLIKPAFSNIESAWHQDYPFWPMKSSDAVTCWIPLSNVNIENGCMKFLKGSHLWNISPSLLPLSINEENQQICHNIMQVGDCSFHNGLVIHGANKNHSQQNRIAFKLVCMKGDTKFEKKHHFITNPLDLKDNEIIEGDHFTTLSQ